MCIYIYRYLRSICKYTHTFTCTNICIYIYRYRYRYRCRYRYIYIYVHIYIYIYTYIPTTDHQPTGFSQGVLEPLKSPGLLGERLGEPGDPGELSPSPAWCGRNGGYHEATIAGHLWLIYGSYMVDIWFIYGSYMVNIWLIYG